MVCVLADDTMLYTGSNIWRRNEQNLTE